MTLVHLLHLEGIDLRSTESWTLGQARRSGQASLPLHMAIVGRSATWRLVRPIRHVGRRRARALLARWTRREGRLEWLSAGLGKGLA